MGYETRLLIGGEHLDGAGTPIEVENPASEETVATVGAASLEQLDLAVRAATEAKGSWGTLPAVDRAPLLHEIATRLREKTQELALLMTTEIGRPLTESADEVEWCAACFDYYAEVARSEIGRVIPPIEASQFSVVVKEPHGVVGCIVPWNFPLLLLVWKVAPALAAGNTIVAKPSELTPLSTLAIADVFSGLPTGTVNLLAGAGDIGAGIAEHPGIDCVAFTGSVGTGRKVGMAAASRYARVNLEMGGKDPFIVCDDIGADGLDVAVKGGVWAACLNAGQVCTSSERFYVMESIFDDFVNAFVEQAKSLVIGDPLNPSTDLGPMVSGPQRARALGQVEDAVASGAELLTGGGNAGFDKGHYLEPCVLTRVPPQADLLREETFGPVAPIVPVKDLDEAIALANGLDFGLGANIYTRDLKRAIRCVKEVRAGSVWINDPLTDNDAGPFGGFKNSGIGRELGTEGLDAFREAKHAHIDTEIEVKDWWYPYGTMILSKKKFELILGTIGAAVVTLAFNFGDVSPSTPIASASQASASSKDPKRCDAPSCAEDRKVVGTPPRDKCTVGRVYVEKAGSKLRRISGEVWALKGGLVAPTPGNDYLPCTRFKNYKLEPGRMKVSLKLEKQTRPPRPRTPPSFSNCRSYRAQYNSVSDNVAGQWVNFNGAPCGAGTYRIVSRGSANHGSGWVHTYAIIEEIYLR